MKRKLAWTLAVIALAMGLTLHFGRTWIAQRLFDRALDQTVGVDQSAKLADGIHVYICGSGSPMPDAAPVMTATLLTRTRPSSAPLRSRTGCAGRSGPPRRRAG